MTDYCHKQKTVSEQLNQNFVTKFKNVGTFKLPTAAKSGIC